MSNERTRRHERRALRFTELRMHRCQRCPTLWSSNAGHGVATELCPSCIGKSPVMAAS